MRRKLATLTVEEEKAWEFYWRHHLMTGRQGQDRAAYRTWKNLQRDFPRLRAFDGCRP